MVVRCVCVHTEGFMLCARCGKTPWSQWHCPAGWAPAIAACKGSKLRPCSHVPIPICRDIVMDHLPVALQNVGRSPCVLLYSLPDQTDMLPGGVLSIAV
jgi:hypothetical protein